ncbi:hypothetical protein BDU57DRAFT_414880, partial [Ampelomyces quisqualis]
LNTLPSELRRLIVCHLTPSPGYYRPGCKIHLQSANMAHSCLREWVPEYMFRDMVLNHVLIGMSSQLERFAVDPLNAKLLKKITRLSLTLRGIAGTHGNRDWLGNTGSAGSVR